MADTYSLKNNAVRAAKKALANGTAPAPTYEIKPAAGGGFRIAWDVAPATPSQQAEPALRVDSTDPVERFAARGIAAQKAVDAEISKAKRQPKANGALAKVTALLQRPGGATVAEVQEATNWLPHTARAFISTKFRGRVTTEKVDGRGRVYRVPA